MDRLLDGSKYNDKDSQMGQVKPKNCFVLHPTHS